MCICTYTNYLNLGIKIISVVFWNQNVYFCPLVVILRNVFIIERTPVIYLWKNVQTFKKPWIHNSELLVKQIVFFKLKKWIKDLTLGLTSNSITAINHQKKILGRYKILKDKSLYFRNVLYSTSLLLFCWVIWLE